MTFIILIIKPFNCGFYLQTDRGWWGGIGGKPASLSEPSFSSINEGLGPGSLLVQFSSVQSFSCVQLFATPWTAALPVHHQLPESTQTHVHWVSDAIQPSHPLPSPSPPAFNLSHHQGLFQWGSSSHQTAKVLEFQLQHQSFQGIFRTDLFYNGLVGSPCSPRDSQESSPTPQFRSISSSVLSFLYSPTLTFIHDYWKKHSFD